MMPNEEKIKRVVGLKYEPEAGPPKVILKGAGRTAEKVLEQARQLAGQRIVEDQQLLDRLFRLPVDAPIDTDLFRLVAALLVHVYTLENALKTARHEIAPISDEGKIQ